MKRYSKSQSLVEFAITIPILLLLLFGIFDLGRAFYIKVVMTNAAREGAKHLAFHPDDKGNGYADTKLAAQNEAVSSGVAITVDDVIAFCTDSDTSGECDEDTPAQVTVELEMNLGIFGLFASTNTISSTANMVVP